MHEGSNAVLFLDGEKHKVSYYKIREDEDNFFCHNVEFTFSEEIPEINPEESYICKLETNGDALWYLPWCWFQKKEKKLEGAIHGAIFCPFGLTEEEENRYDAINLIIASDICNNMTAEVWKNLLYIFGDWLKMKSIPQHKEYSGLGDSIEILEDEDFEEQS